MLLGAQIAGINLFQVNLCKHQMTCDTVMKRHQCSRCPPYERAGWKCSVIFCCSPVP